MARGKQVPASEKNQAVVVVTLRGGGVITSPPTRPSEADLIKHSLLGKANPGHDTSELSWLPESFDTSQVAGVDVRIVSMAALDSAPFPGSLGY